MHRKPTISDGHIAYDVSADKPALPRRTLASAVTALAGILLGVFVFWLGYRLAMELAR